MTVFPQPAPRPVRPWKRLVPTPTSGPSQTIHVTLDGELLVVGFALDVGHRVGRQGFCGFLQNFLQPGLFGILLLYARFISSRRLAYQLQTGPAPAPDGIQIDGRRSPPRPCQPGSTSAAEPRRFQLCRAPGSGDPRGQTPGRAPAGLLAHQGGTHAAEILSAALREAVEEIIGNHQTQDGVPRNSSRSL